MQKCPSGNLGDVSLDVLLSATDLIYNNRFSASESQNGLIFNLKVANINFPWVLKWSWVEKFGQFPSAEQLFFFH